MITRIDKNTALVVIDLQKGITAMETAHPVANVVENVVKLINQFRNEKLPVVIVTVKPSASARQTRKDMNFNRKPGQELPKDFTDLEEKIIVESTDILITKQTWNAFYETTLHSELQKRNVTEIILTGISTSVGVEGTARAASETGYNIGFATDAMTDRSEVAHLHSVNHFFPMVGETVTTNEILKKLKDRK